MTGIVLAGMHRSGTSLTAGLLAAGGWHTGEVTLVGDGEQYEEDASFVALHREWLDACVPPGDGHRDWGVSDGGAVDLATRSAEERAEQAQAAREFAERRDRERPRWVAKDPRASLFLPVWAEVDAVRFLLVYRAPWDVVDSAVRLGAEVFCRRPRLALQAWLDHNQRLAAFAAEHRQRCVVIASEALTLDAADVWRLLDDRFGLDGAAPRDLVDPQRYVRRGDDHPIAELYREVHPEVCGVLDGLDRLADLPRLHAASTSPGRAARGGTLLAGRGVQVIVPCRDDGDFVLEAIASVDDCATRATDDAGRPQVELTVVDDGSTDAETRRVLDALRASGRHVVTTTGVGLAAARNAALATSRTAGVIPLDADNRLRAPLVDALAWIVDGRADIVHGRWQRIGMDRAVVAPPAMTLDALVPDNTIDACALISRALLERTRGWDPALRFWEDWDLWLGALEAGARIERLSTVTFDYLVRPGALSTVPLTDPAARMEVVEHIVTRRAELLGPTLARLVAQAHRSDVAVAGTEAARSDLEQAYVRLEAHHLQLAEEHRGLADAYRGLEAAHGGLVDAYRALEHAHAGALAHAAATDAELTATRGRLMFRTIDPIARRVRRCRPVNAVLTRLRRRLD